MSEYIISLFLVLGNVHRVRRQADIFAHHVRNEAVDQQTQFQRNKLFLVKRKTTIRDQQKIGPMNKSKENTHCFVLLTMMTEKKTKMKKQWKCK